MVEVSSTGEVEKWSSKCENERVIDQSWNQMTRVVQIEETMISLNRELKEYWKRQVESSGSNSKSVVRLAANSLRPNILCRRLADLINSFNKVCVTLFVSIPINQLSTQDSRQQLKRLLYSTSTVKDAYQLQPITKNISSAWITRQCIYPLALWKAWITITV